MQMNKRVGFEEYGKTFQEHLAKLILRDRAFSENIEEVIEIDYFESKYLKIFVKLIFNYRQEYGVHPSESIMETLVRKELDHESDLDKKLVRDFFSRVKTDEKIADKKYIKEKSLDFCRKQKLKSALLKSVQDLERKKYDEIEKNIKEAMKLGEGNDYGHDFIKDFELRYEEKHRNPISTGWDLIDDITKGGHGVGELGVVIAPTGAGKSMVLCHLGAHALKQGKNVVHYTLEMGEDVVGQRYDACLTGHSLNSLDDKKDEVFEEIRKVDGKLIIKEYPTKSATIGMLKRHIDKIVRNNFIPDMIIVDYGDLIKPARAQDQKRYELSDIYEALRGFSKEMGCPIWTASQTNRSGLNKPIVTMEEISEAYSKCFVADFIFSLSRTHEDQESNSGRIFVAKNRNGVDKKIFPIFMDPSRVAIQVHDANGATVDEIMEKDKERRDEKRKNAIGAAWKKIK